MADKKISALTGASTPLAGTEVLPIVQSGSTVKVSVANLTAGRAVSMAGGSFTDDITQSTAAKGINFTANTGTANMTSQLLNWYEEGTWTPTIIGSSTAGTGTYTVQAGKYTRIGRVVTFQAYIAWTAHTGTGNMFVNGLPFNSSADANGFSPCTVYIDGNLTLPANSVIQGYVSVNAQTIALTAITTGGGSPVVVALDTSASIMVSGMYNV